MQHDLSSKPPMLPGNPTWLAGWCFLLAGAGAGDVACFCHGDRFFLQTKFDVLGNCTRASLARAHTCKQACLHTCLHLLSLNFSTKLKLPGSMLCIQHGQSQGLS